MIYARVKGIRELLESIADAKDPLLRTLVIGPRLGEGEREVVIEVESEAKEIKKLIDSLIEKSKATSVRVESFTGGTLHDLRYELPKRLGESQP